MLEFRVAASRCAYDRGYGGNILIKHGKNRTGCTPAEACRSWLPALLLLVTAAGMLSPPVAAQDGAGQPVWVTDEFEITMRNGQGNRQAIIRMLASGTRVERLEKNDESGYSLVRTGSGAEGWVLNRYLLSTPPARVTMPDLQSKLTQNEAQRKQLTRQLREMTAERDGLQRKLQQSASNSDDVQKELSRVRELSSNVIQIDIDNAQLKQSLDETQAELEKARAENLRLASRSSREWFVIGALVVIFGILVGLILPRIRWRRKSSWGEL